MSDDPTAGRVELGLALRRARQAAGLTQIQVAAELRCGQGKINKIETTLVGIDEEELNRLFALYQLSEESIERLKDLSPQGGRRRRRPGRPGATWPPFDRLISLEPNATEILCWHSERIPRHLQSELYMLRQCQADGKTNPDVTSLLREWKARARIFTIEDGPHFQAVLSESSFYRLPGGQRPDLTVDQIQHIQSLVRKHRERLTLRVLRFTANVAFVDTDFELVRAGQQAFAYTESPGGARIYQSPMAFEQHWEQLRSAALSQEDTWRFLEELVGKARAQWAGQT